MAIRNKPEESSPSDNDICHEVTGLLNGNGNGNGNGNDSGVWRDEHSHLPWWKRPSVYWLLCPFFLLAITFGGIIVPRLNLILSLICRDYLAERSANDPTFIFTPVVLDADNPQCRIPEVQAKVATFNLYITVLTGLLSAVMSPKLGVLSDRYGRTRILALACTGLMLSEIVAVIAAKYPTTFTYHYFLLGAALDGLFGSFTAVMSITFAYVSDCTPPDRRAVTFSYFHASLFSGMAMGPLFAAVVLKSTGSMVLLFYISIAAHVLFMAFVFFAVPESVSHGRQKVARANAERSAAMTLSRRRSVKSTITSFFEPLRILWPTGPGSSVQLRRNMALLAMIDTIYLGIAMGGMSVIVYYIGYAFGWSSAESSVYMSLASIARVTGLLVLLPALQWLLTPKHRSQSQPSTPSTPRSSSSTTTPLLNPKPPSTTTAHNGATPSELSIIRIALAIETLGIAGYALSSSGTLFALSGIFAALGGICAPTLQGALTKHVPADRVGQLLGATGLLHALSRVVAPAGANYVYAKTVEKAPWAIFVVLSAWFGAAFGASWFLKAGVSFTEPTVSSPRSPNDNDEDGERAGETTALLGDGNGNDVNAEMQLQEETVAFP